MTKDEYSKINHAHVWGCPAYVLDPSLQDGKKLPKWQPRSRRGQFVGISQDHASTIGEILNLKTGSISPQYHVVYDDWFSTVYSSEDVVPPNWEDLIMFHRENVLPPGISGPPLANDWLSPQELGEHHAPREIGRDDQNRNYVRELRHPPENEGPMEVPIEIDDEVMAPTASPDRTVQNFPLRISPGTRVYWIPEGVTVQNQSPTPRDLDEEFKFERVEQQPVQEDPGPYRTRSGRES
ncbi:MAG: hypothetical protein ACREBR_02260, partial [bacterium]